MYNRKVYIPNRFTFNDYSTRYKRQFFSATKRSSLTTLPERPGALRPEEVKHKIEAVGVGKVIKINRIGFDGTEDDSPIIVEIQSIYTEGFSGKVLNFERQVIDRSSDQVTYSNRGGGIIRFNYLDGDIKEISKSQPVKNTASDRNIDGMSDLLKSLGMEERIQVKYYDRRHRGTVNVEGVLVSKSTNQNTFKMIIDKINNIELESKFSQQFDIERELVVDIASV